MDRVKEKPVDNAGRHRKVRVLVVDDDMRLRELLRRYLSEQGFTVDVAPDAVEAMARNAAREEVGFFGRRGKSRSCRESCEHDRDEP